MKYGKPPEERTVEELIEKGLIVLDKPSGPTAHEVVAWVKKILNIKKAGHSGTLDPHVTGVLPVATQKATRVLKLMLESDKEYICAMRFHKPVPEKKLREICKEFTGKIYQKPPVKSAVKRKLRVKEVKNIEILEIEERNVLMRVSCEAGTYIRKLCYDIGEALGVGANMENLRRTKVGHLWEENVITLQDLLDAYIFWKEEGMESEIRRCVHPIEEGINIPRIWIRDTAVDAVCHGAKLMTIGVKKCEEIQSGERVAVMTLKNELVALGKALMSSREMLEQEGVAVTTERVLMERGTYPKIWKIS
ncbi:MAG: RNA-guided pseudouridylation complex pseudouridine synthase subunit Cbf5 [Methanomicrobia archaeon]|nr:RNA-guided pseudouridylation complex pseudouridine synthase subunit Cbf5 [Methanomicrobia archaeon]MCK4636807.1 RNA-guided pseudouridylation complex pseudouridine synthase subunit Cbf5 [Methanomicrobia archaeon]